MKKKHKIFIKKISKKKNYMLMFALMRMRYLFSLHGTESIESIQKYSQLNTNRNELTFKFYSVKIVFSGWFQMGLY